MLGGTSTSRTLLASAAAAARIDAASAWLASRKPAEETLVVAASAPAGAELVRSAAGRTAHGAAFGWHRETPWRLAANLAAETLAVRDRVPVGHLACVAVAAGVIQELAAAGKLGRYAGLANAPTFARAAASTLGELHFASVPADALSGIDPGLAELLRAYDAALEASGLIDRAGVFDLAATLARDAAFVHPLLDRPTLMLDVPLESTAELALVEAVAARAPELLATTPVGDRTSRSRYVDVLGLRETPVALGEDGSLSRLQEHLFGDGMPEPSNLDDGVVVLSAPGESRECVEIARRLLEHAARGVPFDRMAILLRSIAEYRPHLEEALHRAGIPGWFASGARRPDPAGRALLSLLACREEGFSARRFAEYLSLSEVPDASAEGTPPPAPIAGDRWVAPDEDLVPTRVAPGLAFEETLASPLGESEAVDGADDPVEAGTLRAPRHWERLLVEAAVIGGRERWVRRLDGLAESLRLDLDERAEEDEAAAERIGWDLEALESLRNYALPLLDQLAALPESGTWGEWIDAISLLASRSLRRPDRVLSVLGELAPMAKVGPVTLPQVRMVLAERLLALDARVSESRHGCVFIASAEAARGLAFDVVAIPGLAERLFPRKISEEPLLLDARRHALRSDLAGDFGGGVAGALDTNDERVARERLALQIATGAARDSLLLTYPRLDLDQSRPRVPSFYALEALRAAEGKLPGFDELAQRAERIGAARIGWPAPEDPLRAIDAAEHDLALLDQLLAKNPEESAGAARYLLTANPHLGRALRFRARRWLGRWTEADGLTPRIAGELASGARAEIARHRLAARSYSATALQHFSACPYRFFLQAVHRLAPREEPESIDELDPLHRGSLVHDVQFELFGELSERGLLPVTAANLEEAQEVLEPVLDEIAGRYRDDLAPAIDRVFEDGVTAIRADLREWLLRASTDESGFVPWRFELAFGLAGRRYRDPHSRPDPVTLDSGIRLRGSIDLVERRADGVIRVTDHKTGKTRVKEGEVIAGGGSLQPVLYALASEKLFPEATVSAGRLYYCTSAGGFEEREVPVDDEARASAQLVADVIDAALEEPFLPAAPAEGACRYCDYAVVCGPYEELRTARKRHPADRLDPLRSLREIH